MGERKALGKGLAALLGQRPGGSGEGVAGRPAPAQAGAPPASQQPAAPSQTASGVRPGPQHVPVSQITPNPDQPRDSLAEDALQELADSIARDGVIQPIVVRESGTGFVIIAGERRWRASQLAGLDTIPVIVHDLQDETDSLRLALVENIQRRDLNPLEEARAYRELIQRCGLTQEQLADQVSRSRSAVTNILRLLNLPDEVQAMLAGGALSMGHARALLGTENANTQRAAAKRIVAEGLSVRDAERLMGRRRASGRGKTAAGAPRTPRDPYFASLEAQLRGALGTKVQITATGKTSGRIAIDYYSLDELEGLLQRFGVASDYEPSAVPTANTE